MRFGFYECATHLHGEVIEQDVVVVPFHDESRGLFFQAADADGLFFVGDVHCCFACRDGESVGIGGSVFELESIACDDPFGFDAQCGCARAGGAGEIFSCCDVDVSSVDAHVVCAGVQSQRRACGGRLPV